MCCVIYEFVMGNTNPDIFIAHIFDAIEKIKNYTSQKSLKDIF